jgi:hypothetical protein
MHDHDDADDDSAGGVCERADRLIKTSQAWINQVFLGSSVHGVSPPLFYPANVGGLSRY